MQKMYTGNQLKWDTTTKLKFRSSFCITKLFAGDVLRRASVLGLVEPGGDQGHREGIPAARAHGLPRGHTPAHAWHLAEGNCCNSIIIVQNNYPGTWPDIRCIKNFNYMQLHTWYPVSTRYPGFFPWYRVSYILSESNLLEIFTWY